MLSGCYKAVCSFPGLIGHFVKLLRSSTGQVMLLFLSNVADRQCKYLKGLVR